MKIALYMFIFVLLDTGAEDSILEWTAENIPEI